MAKRKTKLISQPQADPLRRAARNWQYGIGDTVIAGPGLPIKEGTRVSVKILVPGVHEPGYIVGTEHNGDYWVRETEVKEAAK